jgi:hypothetical protein
VWIYPFLHFHRRFRTSLVRQQVLSCAEMNTLISPWPNVGGTSISMFFPLYCILHFFHWRKSARYSVRFEPDTCCTLADVSVVCIIDILSKSCGRKIINIIFHESKHPFPKSLSFVSRRGFLFLIDVARYLFV